jgi:transmembrane sensor
MEHTPTDRTLQEAARWHARMSASDISDEERFAFDHWLAADPSHAAAYEQANRTTAAIDQLLLNDSRLQALLDDAVLAAAVPAERSAPYSRTTARRLSIPFALAASIALCVFSLQFVADGTRPSDPTRIFETVDARRSVQLQDGSVAQLDVGTRIRVRMTPQRRLISLESGRAMFDVAHDASRPFAVTAATSRTTALGTKFQVQLRDDQVVVTLAEGSVAVDNEDSTQVWQEHLRPGEQLKIDVQTANRDKDRVDPSVATSWTRGRLLFRNTRLQDALEEVNRYSTKKVRLGDPSLGDMFVGGNFIAGDSTIIVDALAAVLPLRVVDGGDKEIILFRRYENAP